MTPNKCILEVYSDCFGGINIYTLFYKFSQNLNSLTLASLSASVRWDSFAFNRLHVDIFYDIEAISKR